MTAGLFSLRATTGSFTIPMMKKAGFKATFASAVELASATGGAISPPIMASVAFLMSEITGIPYAQICVAAIISSVLWYWAIYVQVHFEGLKQNIHRLPEEQIPSAWKVLMHGGHHFLPLVAIVVAMFMGYSPLRAVLWGLATTVAVGLISKETRRNIVSRVLQGLEDGAKTAVVVAMALAAGQLMISAINPTGIGGKLASILVTIAGGQVLT